ncbi:unnamed protein product, partial [Rotaria magnacalcarata]
MNLRLPLTEVKGIRDRTMLINIDHWCDVESSDQFHYSG